MGRHIVFCIVGCNGSGELVMAIEYVHVCIVDLRLVSVSSKLILILDIYIVGGHLTVLSLCAPFQLTQFRVSA